MDIERDKAGAQTGTFARADCLRGSTSYSSSNQSLLIMHYKLLLLSKRAPASSI